MVFPLSANAQNGITTNSDLNGDGKSDLLWYNPVSGQTVAWLMDGTTTASSAALLNDPNWKILKTGDFNGDGIADLLCYNASTGETAAWLMNGTSVSARTVLLTEVDWKVIEAADFNGDGKTDLLWYNASTGETAAWLMNGTSVLTWKVLLSVREWKVIAAADLNGDGKADLLWHNTSTGQTAVWLMDGTSVLTWTVILTDYDWNIITATDLNGDGMADLLWENASTGETAAWLMNGTSTTAWTVLPSDSNWKVVATADLNGDGKADLLWRNKAGQTTAWLMNGTNITAIASLMSDPNWAITATADLNGDGKADLLWYNTTTGQTSVWLMNGTSATSSANLFTDTEWKLKCIKSSSMTSTMVCVDTMTNAASGLMPLNQSPVVSAGADQTITLPASANLSGNASDDGSPIALLIATWSQVSGPGTVTFGNSANLRTTAAFSAAGTYTLRLTASDSALSASDDVVIVVNGGGSGSAPINKAPVVNAGPDQAVSLASGASLLGSASDDGLPMGSAVSATWSRISGPGAVSFGNASALTTTANFSAAGTYTLRLTVSDGSLSTSDDVVVVVNGCGKTFYGSVAVDSITNDNVGVAGVQAQVDGVNIGPYLTSAPFSVIWNTTTVSNGCHLISATARDLAGNSATATVWVAVSNP